MYKNNVKCLLALSSYNMGPGFVPVMFLMCGVCVRVGGGVLLAILSIKLRGW